MHSVVVIDDMRFAATVGNCHPLNIRRCSCVYVKTWKNATHGGRRRGDDRIEIRVFAELSIGGLQSDEGIRVKEKSRREMKMSESEDGSMPSAAEQASNSAKKSNPYSSNRARMTTASLPSLVHDDEEEEREVVD